jgi:mevalonate kinase
MSGLKKVINRLEYTPSTWVDFQKKVGTGCVLNLDQLLRDVNKGLYFESSIPQGYGLGSSGALVAAIYNKYAEEKIKSDRRLSRKSVSRLKEIFSKMEGFFSW